MSKIFTEYSVQQNIRLFPKPSAKNPNALWLLLSCDNVLPQLSHPPGKALARRWVVSVPPPEHFAHQNPHIQRSPHRIRNPTAQWSVLPAPALTKVWSLPCVRAWWPRWLPWDPRQVVVMAGPGPPGTHQRPPAPKLFPKLGHHQVPLGFISCLHRGCPKVMASEGPVLWQAWLKAKNRFKGGKGKRRKRREHQYDPLNLVSFVASDQPRGAAGNRTVQHPLQQPAVPASRWRGEAVRKHLMAAGALPHPQRHWSTAALTPPHQNSSPAYGSCPTATSVSRSTKLPRHKR